MTERMPFPVSMHLFADVSIPLFERLRDPFSRYLHSRERNGDLDDRLYGPLDVRFRQLLGMIPYVPAFGPQDIFERVRS